MEFSEHVNEVPGSKKIGEFFDKLNDYQLLEKDSIPWG
jgi:hypothetical protein